MFLKLKNVTYSIPIDENIVKNIASAIIKNTPNQECKARKVYCGRVYSGYILKPVLFGRNL